MDKYVIFYEHLSDYGYVYIDAVNFEDALSISGSFSRKTGYRIVGICKETLLNFWIHE
jgi:hypothetical protein